MGVGDMPELKVEPIRIQMVINTPFRVWTVLVLAVLAVIIAINAN